VLLSKGAKSAKNRKRDFIWCHLYTLMQEKRSKRI
jgi:hypothetical protein